MILTLNNESVTLFVLAIIMAKKAFEYREYKLWANTVQPLKHEKQSW